MYRDSTLGLCLDLTGPEGNVFALMGIAMALARQIGGSKKIQEVKDSFEAAQEEGDYIAIVRVFQSHFPIVTLVGLETVITAQEEQA